MLWEMRNGLLHHEYFADSLRKFCCAEFLDNVRLRMIVFNVIYPNAYQMDRINEY